MQRFSIGHSRSKKLVTLHPELDSLESPIERFDAMTMLDAIAARTYRREGDSDLVRHLRQSCDKIRRSLKDEGIYEILMDEIGCKTSLDLTRYAQLLLLPEFKD